MRQILFGPCYCTKQFQFRTWQTFSTVVLLHRTPTWQCTHSIGHWRRIGMRASLAGHVSRMWPFGRPVLFYGRAGKCVVKSSLVVSRNLVQMCGGNPVRLCRDLVWIRKEAERNFRPIEHGWQELSCVRIQFLLWFLNSCGPAVNTAQTREPSRVNESKAYWKGPAKNYTLLFLPQFEPTETIGVGRSVTFRVTYRESCCVKA